MVLTGRRLAAAWLVACLVLVLPHASFAQDTDEEADPDSPRGGVVINLPPSPTFASQIIVVDVQRILDEARAVRVMRDELSQARQVFQAEMRAREADLQERDKALAAEREGMDPVIFQTERERLAQDLASMQEDIRSWFRMHDQALNQAMRRTQDVLLRIVGEMARQRGASVVIPKSSIVLVQPELDITDAALKRLNEELTSLSLPESLVAPQ